MNKLVYIVILLLSLMPCGASADPRVWFTPRDNLARPGFYAGSPDFMDLFRPNAPWTQAAGHVQVFKIYPQFVLSASDADLRTVIVGLQQRNIALALEFGLLTNLTLCGKIEGYCGEQIGQAVSRIKALGGTLAYVAMDEPLWFGHKVVGTPIATLAQDVAKQVATIHRYFPHAQVGDIEPLLGSEGPVDYASQVQQWQAAYRHAVGVPLAFFHVELNWQSPVSRLQLGQVYTSSKFNGIKFGIIYDGDWNDPTGLVWTTNAEKYFADVEQSLIPDDAVLQTWEPQPDHALPETQPGTMTYLVNRYATAETVLFATRTSTGFAGAIVSGGAPLDNVQIYAATLGLTPPTMWVVPTDPSGMFVLNTPTSTPVVFNYLGDSSHRLSTFLVR
jgi:hypothetical protein